MAHVYIEEGWAPWLEGHIECRIGPSREMLRLKRGIPVWEKGKKSMGCNKGGICPEVKVDKESQKKDSRFYLTGFINSEVEGTIFHSFLSYAQSDWKLFLD